MSLFSMETTYAHGMQKSFLVQKSLITRRGTLSPPALSETISGHDFLSFRSEVHCKLKNKQTSAPHSWMTTSHDLT